MSGAAYKRFKDSVLAYGLIVYDPAFVEEVDKSLPCTQKALPAKELAVKHFQSGRSSPMPSPWVPWPGC